MKLHFSLAILLSIGITVNNASAGMTVSHAVAVEDNCRERNKFKESPEEYEQRCQKTGSIQQQSSISEVDFCKLFDGDCKDSEQFIKNTFNPSVAEHQVKYQAGTVEFKNDYEIKNKIFPFSVQLKPWTRKLIYLKQGSIQIPPDKAELLYKESQEESLPLFFTVISQQGNVIVDKVFLFGQDREWQVTEEASMSNPLVLKCDPFETSVQCNARKRRAVMAYNQAVKDHRSKYQAGSAQLQKEQYNQKSGKFPVTIKWTDFAKEWFQTCPENSITASLDEARDLWDEGKSKPVFVYIDGFDSGKTSLKTILSGLGKEWKLNKTFEECNEKSSNRCKDECNQRYYRDEYNRLYLGCSKIISNICIALATKTNKSLKECYEALLKEAKKDPKMTCADYLLVQEKVKETKGEYNSCMGNCK